MIQYNDYVTAFSNKFTRIVLKEEYIKQIDQLVETIIKEKSKEHHHIIDNNNERKRFTTGFQGEAAIEQLLGIPIIDWTKGNSKDYHHPDIPNYNVGIKTVEKGKFPIIFKKNFYPQIMCIKSDYKSNLIFVCGIATPEVLNKYQDDSLIIDDKLRKRGTKTGFYGYQHLIHLHSIDDIKMYKK